MSSWLKNNFFIFFFGIFALIGTCMGIGGAAIWLQGVRLSNDGIQTTGLVTDLVRSGSGNTQAPVVEFTLKNGEKHVFKSGISSSPPAYDVGERVTLWYNPADPDDVLLSGMDSWFIPAMFGFFFLIFGGIGYGGLLYQWMKKRDVNWLKQNGQSVEADFTGVFYNTSVKMNGASPWVIQGQWFDKATNKMYVFESDNIWFDPSAFVQGEKIRVLIDPKNPGLYTVDLSFLPEEGN